MALTALARFARLSRTPSIDLNVEITHEGGSHKFDIKDENAIMLQEFVVINQYRFIDIKRERD